MRPAAFLLAALTLCAQPSRKPVEVLSRARARILDTVDRLPKYTCVQTVERRYFNRYLPSSRNCADALAYQNAGEPALELNDRLRLDVAVDESGGEIYSWAGGSQFESKQVADLIGGGPIGTGSFGSFLIGIFASPGVVFVYQDQEDVAGQSLLAYRFRVPIERSHYEFQAAGRKKVIAYDGIFWLDPESAGLRRLQVHAVKLPEELGTCEATTTVDFARARIGSGVYLLPRESHLYFVGIGRESENVSTWSACREYHGESVVHFDDAGTTSSASPAAPSRTPGLPRGLHVLLAFESEIDFDTAAAGDPVIAKVRRDVADPRSKRILVPAGAIVRGRITRLAHQMSPGPYFIMSILFDTLESSGVITRFSAMLDPKAGPLAAFSVSVADLLKEKAAGRQVSPRIAPGTEFSARRTLVFPSGASRYVVPRGFESHWLTNATTAR